MLNCIAYLSRDKNVSAREFIVGKSDSVSLKSVKVAKAIGVCENEFCEEVEKLISEDSPRRISQLDINGNDILNLGISGEKIGVVLNDLILLVSNSLLNNDKKRLEEYIKKRYL